MKDAENIYTELWEKTIPLFEQGNYEIDPLVDDPVDMRRGLTLRARLTGPVVSTIHEYAEELKALLPNQYFTPDSDLHLTLLTVMSCSRNFNHNPEMDDTYSALIAECVRDLPPLRITFRGITVSPSCLLVRGYPEDDRLQMLRNQLREQFKASSLPSTVDFRYPLKTAHVTIMRFIRAKNDLSRFIRFIKESQHHPFGTQTIDAVEFVANDWCHKNSNTRLIRSFRLD